jgi:Tol biopolymer transport system component
MYEMLAARSPFRGEHDAAIAYSIVNEDPLPLIRYNNQVSEQLEHVVSKALSKKRDERYQHADDLLADLRRIKRESDSSRVSALSAPLSSSNAVPNPSQKNYLRFRNDALLWPISAGLFLLASLILASMYFLKTQPEVRTYRYTISPPKGLMFRLSLDGDFAISSDGRLLAFVATDSSDKDILWVRSLSSLESKVLSGTEGAGSPFWSPDGRFIGFFAGGRLKRVEVTGGTPQTICDAPIGRGGSWSKDGTIVFATGRDVPLSRVSAAGGLPATITSLDTLRHETSHRWPHFLPDGRHFLYLARTEITGTGEKDAIILSSLDSTSKPRVLIKASSNAEYANGHLFFAREQSLLAQPFDPERLELTGDLFRITEQLYHEPVSSHAAFSLSTTGTLSYFNGGALEGRLVWYDRKGKQLGDVVRQAFCYDIQLSPDQKKAAISVYDFSTMSTDIWLCEFRRNVWERFTSDPGADRFPIWSPDGNTLAYSAFRGGQGGLYQRMSNGMAAEQLLLALDNPRPTDWSRDGLFLAFTASSPQNNNNIWTLPMLGDRKPRRYFESQYSESGARFSPDGHWIAYQSDESGSIQIYVRPFPGSGSKWRVSTNGGSRPRWRGDAKELFYTRGNQIVAVDLKLARNTVEVGSVKPLFTFRPLGTLFTEIYDVSPDGQRFLFSVAAGDNRFSATTLVVNWDAELKKKWSANVDLR